MSKTGIVVLAVIGMFILIVNTHSMLLIGIGGILAYVIMLAAEDK